MKKCIVFFLISVLCLGLIACGTATEETTPPTITQKPTQPAATEVPTLPATTEIMA